MSIGENFSQRDFYNLLLEIYLKVNSTNEINMLLLLKEIEEKITLICDPTSGFKEFRRKEDTN